MFAELFHTVVCDADFYHMEILISMINASEYCNKTVGTGRHAGSIAKRYQSA